MILETDKGVRWCLVYYTGTNPEWDFAYAELHTLAHIFLATCVFLVFSLPLTLFVSPKTSSYSLHLPLASTWFPLSIISLSQTLTHTHTHTHAHASLAFACCQVSGCHSTILLCDLNQQLGKLMLSDAIPHVNTHFLYTELCMPKPQLAFSCSIEMTHMG